MSRSPEAYTLAHSASPAADLVRRGAFATILEQAASPEASPAEDLYFLAMGLRRLGRCLPDGDQPSAVGLLERIGGLSADADLLALAAIEDVRARFEADQDRRALVRGLEGAMKAYLKAPAVAPRARLLRALIHIQDNQNKQAEAALALALRDADEQGATFLRADVLLAIGRMRAWQGIADTPEQILGEAAEPWRAHGNAVAVADVDYELGVYLADRRAFGDAGRTLRSVLEVYAANGVTGTKRARAENALLNALLGSQDPDGVRALLDELDDAGLVPKRLGPRLRSRARFELLTPDRGGLARAGRFVGRAQEVLRDERAAGFNNLSVDLADARVRWRVAQDADARLAAGDAAARVAVAFSGSARERPHEIDARLAAIDAYLGAHQATSGSDRARSAAESAAVDQVHRLARAAASIALPLSDPEATGILRRAEAELPSETVSAAVRSLLQGRTDQPLLHALDHASDDDAIELLARLADQLTVHHRAGEAPVLLTPSQVIVVEPGQPVILTARGLPTVESRLPAPSIGDRAFVAPERLRRRGPVDARSDLYLLGTLIMARCLAARPPPNQGPGLRVKRGLWNMRWWDVTRRARGKTRELARLAYQLTAVDPKLRPATAQDVSDRLRRALWVERTAR